MYLRTALSKNKATVKDISIGDYKDNGIKNYELSEEVYQFTALEKLYISGDFKALDPKIANLQKLQSLTIQSNLLEDLPEEIGLLPNLKYLSINSNSISKLPQSLGQLKHLENFQLWRSTKITKVPDTLAALPNLKSISIYWSKIKDLSAFDKGFDALETFHISESPLNNKAILPIFQLKRLMKLTITCSELTKIPIEILQLKDLDTLVLSENRLQEIPDFMGQLSNLKHFNFEKNKIAEFPTFLSQMPSIKRIFWQDNSFGKYDKALLLFPIETTNPYYKSADSKKYRSFIEQVIVQQFSPTTLELFFDIQSNRSLEQGKFKRADFINILSFNDKSFKASAINQLLDYECKHFDPKMLEKEGAALCVLGKTSLSKSEIRSILKEKGVQYQTKISPSTTHILVGNSGIKNYAILADPTYTLVSQQTFQNYANSVTKPYLLDEESKDNLEHISSLLLSTDIENQSLGIELLKGGGTPKELLTELFVVFKFSEDKKLAAKAKKLLSTNAPKEVLEKLKLRINLRSIKEAYKTQHKLEQLTEGTDLEIWKIAQYAYRYQPQVWAPKIPLGLKDAPKKSAINFLVNAVRQEMHKGAYVIEPDLLPYIDLLYENCSFLTSIRFNQLAQNIDGIAKLPHLEQIGFYFVENAEFPKDLHLLGNLKSVSFTRTTTKDWSMVFNQLAQISSLRKIYVWGSTQGALPPEFAKLKMLEHFVCSNNPLSKNNLQILAQLPHLIHVDLEDSSEHLDERYLLLKNLQTLRFHNSNTYHVTQRIAELKSLKTLILTGALGLPDDIAAMPMLEELYIKTGYRAPHPVHYNQIKNLRNLKRLTIRGKAEDLANLLPHFSKLEYLELYHNKIELGELIQVLAVLPNLKTFKRYLSAPDHTTLQKAFPNIKILTS